MKILFQGDSITDCGRLESGGAGYERGEMGMGYPSLVKGRLGADRPQADMEFVNRGISGNRTVDLYARWKADCINLAPDVVSILAGVNDSIHEFKWKNGVEVPRAARIYGEILDWTVSALPDVRFILMEPFTVPGSDYAAAIGAEVRERAASVKASAERLGEGRAAFVPLQSIVDAACERAPWGHWSADGIHPSPALHQLFADAWLGAFASIAPKW